MTDVRLQTQIEKAFEDRAKITSATEGGARHAVDEALDLLDRGKARVAEKLPGAAGPNSWKVNQWLKKAVLLSFRLNDNVLIDGGPDQASWWDKIPSKLEGWGENRFNLPTSRGFYPTRIKSPRSWKVGARTDSRTRAFAPSRARSCDARPSSPAMSC